jgi:hypothetical protein
MVIWYILWLFDIFSPILVFWTKKNLATLVILDNFCATQKWPMYIFESESPIFSPPFRQKAIYKCVTLAPGHRRAVPRALQPRPGPRDRELPEERQGVQEYRPGDRIRRFFVYIHNTRTGLGQKTSGSGWARAVNFGLGPGLGFY